MKINFSIYDNRLYCRFEFEDGMSYTAFADDERAKKFIEKAKKKNEKIEHDNMDKITKDYNDLIKLIENEK